jgi:hypothetical protein
LLDDFDNLVNASRSDRMSASLQTSQSSNGILPYGQSLRPGLSEGLDSFSKSTGFQR